MTAPGAGGATRLVLYVHGSRDPRWRAPFEALESDLRRSEGADRVRLAYMEFVAPTLIDVADEAVRDGVARLRLLPLFMAGGAHVDRDIPEQVAAVRARHPGLGLDVLPPIGEDPRVASLRRSIASEAARG